MQQVLAAALEAASDLEHDQRRHERGCEHSARRKAASAASTSRTSPQNGDRLTPANLPVLPRGAGERMACPLMRRLAAIGLPVLVVAQYDPDA